MASYTGSAASRKSATTTHGRETHERTHGSILRRIRAEYAEMPGLSLTLAQAVRLFGLEKDTCRGILGTLVTSGYLRESDGRFMRA
jgi:hypothetical protein